MLAAAEGIVPRDEIFAATGLQFMEINSLYQLLALKQKQPGLLRAADRLLMIPDLVHWLLSGQRSNERTNASTTQCFDPQTGDWSRKLLDRFGLPLHVFGPLIEPGTDLGELRGDIAADTGLAGVRVVVPGTHDTASAVAAVPAAEPPAARPDWCYVSLGTWALVGAELDRPLVTPECLAHNFTNEGGVGGTTRLLKNVCGLWLVQQCRAAWQRAGKEWTWDQLTSLAAEAPEGVVVERARADFPTLMANCTLSVSQGGYNTVMEMMTAGTRGVIVPYAGGLETEQTLRARLLENHSGIRTIPENTLDADTLARAVDAALDAPPPDSSGLDTGGADASARLIAGWLGAPGQPAP